MRIGRSVAIGVLAAAAIAGSALPASAQTAPLTKAHAKTIAKHINFRASDFPGYKVHPYKSSASGDAMAKRFN